MTIVNKLQRLDGRHKLAIIMAIGTWLLSIYFSYLGFKLDNSKMSWIGYFLGALVTTVELIFNSKTHKISLTLILVGVLCYAYGIWTNIIGFWSFQHPDTTWAWTSAALMPGFVGLILEVLPEAMFMWGIGAELDGDLIGNIVGLWSGDLDYASPSNGKVPTPPSKHSNQNPIFSSQKPNRPGNSTLFSPTQGLQAKTLNRREMLERERAQAQAKKSHHYNGE